MNTNLTNNQLPTVAIIGAGFGGLRAAKALEHAPLRVILIDRNNYHLFQPLLYQVATGGLSPDEIAYPVRTILSGQKNIEFKMAEIQEIQLAHKRLRTQSDEISYDYLIVSVGGVTNYFGMPSLADHSAGLKELPDARAIRNQILYAFEQASQDADPIHRQRLLTFVVVGGGPTGVECAGAIQELVHLLLTKDYPKLDPGEAHVLLLEASEHLLPAMPANLSQAALLTLRHKGVDVQFGAAVSAYENEMITLKSGHLIPAHTLIWAAGVRANPLLEKLGLPTASLGRLQVEPTLQLPGHPQVFVIGDAAHLEDMHGKPLPMLAPVAIQQGQQAARNIINLLRGQPLQPFTYHDQGSMATVGRNQAVAQVGKVSLKGFIAWLAWLMVHLIQLIGFRNRLLVLVDWAWQYFTYDRAVRLIDTVPGETNISNADAHMALLERQNLKVRV